MNETQQMQPEDPPMQKDTGRLYWHHWGLPLSCAPVVLAAFVTLAYLVPGWLSSWQGFLISLIITTGLVHIPLALLAKWWGWYAPQTDPLKERNPFHFGGGSNDVALVAAWLIFPHQGVVQPWWLYVIAYFITRITVMIVFRVLVGPAPQEPTQSPGEQQHEVASDADTGAAPHNAPHNAPPEVAAETVGFVSQVSEEPMPHNHPEVAEKRVAPKWAKQVRLYLTAIGMMSFVRLFMEGTPHFLWGGIVLLLIGFILPPLVVLLGGGYVEEKQSDDAESV